jgi:hypothetical protein
MSKNSRNPMKELYKGVTNKYTPKEVKEAIKTSMKIMPYPENSPEMTFANRADRRRYKAQFVKDQKKKLKRQTRILEKKNKEIAKIMKK